jgi:cholest-4-en-3-one 26-monooxygenase
MTTSTLVNGIDINLSKEQFGRSVPFDAFEVLRENAPLYWYEPEQYWVVTSHELLGRINRDPQRFSSSGGPAPARIGPDPFRNSLTLLTMDPPEHTAYRRRVSRPFAPRPVANLEGKARSIIRELLDEFIESGGGDFVTDVAALYPLRVMGVLLGIEREDEPAVNRRMNAIVQGSDPEYGASSDQEKLAIAQEANDYYDRLINEHRQNPRGDLIDKLLESKIDGVGLTDDELRAWIGMFTAGGAETTRHLISQGLLALLEWPEERRKLVDGSDVATAVEEMLRWVSPVMHHSRWPAAPFEFDGQTIEVGQRTTLWMISGNRDRQAFASPDTFDVTRTPNHHDSLGAGGPHFCLGAGMARLETRVLFEELRPHLERMSIDGSPVRAQTTMFNSLKHLPIVVGVA